MNADDVVVARVCEDQWSAVREVRLAALAESPAAFGSNLLREQGYDETRWRDWVRSAALFLASAEGMPVGIAAGVAGDSTTSRKLVAVWVSPDWRRRGASSQPLASNPALPEDEMVLQLHE